MDFLTMFEHPTVRLWLAQATVLFFLICGTALLAIGIGLIVNSGGALRMVVAMNRWVSMRRATRSIEIPRDSSKVVQRYRYGLAVVFVAGGAFATWVLLTRYELQSVITMFGLKAMNPALSVWIIDTVRWLLIIGNVAAVAVGILLGFFPETMNALEARGGRWFSQRQMSKGAAAPHLTLDHWVEAHPRAAGWVIIAFALFLIGAFALIVPKVV